MSRDLSDAFKAAFKEFSYLWDDAFNAALNDLLALASEPKNLVSRIDRTVSVAVIGHVDHGKTTLTASLTKVIHDAFGLSLARDYYGVKRTEEERKREVTIVSSTIESLVVDKNGALVRFITTDCPGHRDYIKNLVAGASATDFAIVTVAASKGVEIQTLSHLLLIQSSYKAKPLANRVLCVAITQIDLIDYDRDLLDLIRAQIEETLAKFGDTFTRVEFFECSAYVANQGDLVQRRNVFKIVDSIVNDLPQPHRPVDSPFLLNVEQIYNVKGRGIIIAGTVKEGTVKPQDIIEILFTRQGKIEKAQVISIESFNKPLAIARPGDSIAIVLKTDMLESIEKGCVLSAPGKIQMKHGFVANAYMYEVSEGGRASTTMSGFQPSFFFGTQQYTVTVVFLSGLNDAQKADVIELVKNGARINLANTKPDAGAGAAAAQANELRNKSIKLKSILDAANAVFKGAEAGTNHECIVVLNDPKCRLNFKIGDRGTAQEGHKNVMALNMTEVF